MCTFKNKKDKQLEKNNLRHKNVNKRTPCHVPDVVSDWSTQDNPCKFLRISFKQCRSGGREGGRGASIMNNIFSIIF